MNNINAEIDHKTNHFRTISNQVDCWRAHIPFERGYRVLSVFAITILRKGERDIGYEGYHINKKLVYK